MSFDLNVVAAFIIGSTITYMATESPQPTRKPQDIPRKNIEIRTPNVTRKNIEIRTPNVTRKNITTPIAPNAPLNPKPSNPSLKSLKAPNTLKSSLKAPLTPKPSKPQDTSLKAPSNPPLKAPSKSPLKAPPNPPDASLKAPSKSPLTPKPSNPQDTSLKPSNPPLKAPPNPPDASLKTPSKSPLKSSNALKAPDAPLKPSDAPNAPVIPDVTLVNIDTNRETTNFGDYYDQGQYIKINGKNHYNRCLICSLAVILNEDRTTFYTKLIDQYKKNGDKIISDSFDKNHFENQFLPKDKDDLIEVGDFMTVFKLCKLNGIVFFHTVFFDKYHTDQLKFPTNASNQPGYYVEPVTEETPYIFNTGIHFVVGKGKLTKNIIDYVRTYYIPVDGIIPIDC